MPNITSSVSVTVSATDANNAQPITRQFTITYPGKTGDFGTYMELTTPATDYPLPFDVSPGLVCMVRNLHATAKVTIKATPQGGAEATVTVLGPGACFLVANPTTAATFGYTSIKANSDTAATQIEYYIGG